MSLATVVSWTKFTFTVTPLRYQSFRPTQTILKAQIATILSESMVTPKQVLGKNFHARFSPG